MGCDQAKLLLFLVFLFFPADKAIHIHHRPDSELHDQFNGEWCQSWKNLVCGSDGITYWNECLFTKKRAKQPELEIISVGACADVECDDCANDDGGEAGKLRICTSNNLLLNSTCQLTCLTEDYPLAKEYFHGCHGSYPSVAEMESASPRMFIEMLEYVLTRTLPTSGTSSPRTASGVTSENPATPLPARSAVPVPPSASETQPPEPLSRKRRYCSRENNCVTKYVSTRGARIGLTHERDLKTLNPIASNNLEASQPASNLRDWFKMSQKDNTDDTLNNWADRNLGNQLEESLPRASQLTKRSFLINTEKSLFRETRAVKSGSRKDSLAPFNGFINHEGIQYRIVAKKGWMSEILWFSTPDTFWISAEKSGRLKFRLKTPSLETGYDHFTIVAGRNRSKSKMALTLNNATLVVVADVVSDLLNCARIVPVEVSVNDFPAINIHTDKEIQLPETFPKHDLDGFMKEKFFYKVNEAVEKTLYTRMHRVGCLKWTDDGKSCFGAFQTRFCSQEQLKD